MRIANDKPKKTGPVATVAKLNNTGHTSLECEALYVLFNLQSYSTSRLHQARTTRGGCSHLLRQRSQAKRLYSVVLMAAAVQSSHGRGSFCELSGVDIFMCATQQVEPLRAYRFNLQTFLHAVYYKTLRASIQ